MKQKISYINKNKYNNYGNVLTKKKQEVKNF